MRNLLVLFSLTVFIFGCRDNASTEGLWFSKDVGLIYLSEDSAALFRPRCIHPAELKRISHNSFLIEDELTKLCSKRHNGVSQIKIKVVLDNCGNLLVNSNSPCFGELSNKSNYRLSRLNELSSYVDYETLSVIKKDNRNIKELLLAKQELDSLGTDLLQIEEQMWLVFESGLDFNNEESSLDPYIFRLKGEDYSNSKSIHIYPMPCYLERLFGFVEEEI